MISATNRKLDKLVADGTFREDLYYRLSVVPIRVPGLRERPQDIAALVEYFLEDFCSRNNFRPKRIDAEVLPILERHGWPGNIRELRNAIERMAILTSGDRITVDSVPLEIRAPPSSPSGLHEARDTAERERIVQVLDQTNWKRCGGCPSAGHRAHESSTSVFVPWV